MDLCLHKNHQKIRIAEEQLHVCSLLRRQCFVKMFPFAGLAFKPDTYLIFGAGRKLHEGNISDVTCLFLLKLVNYVMLHTYKKSLCIP